MKCKYCGMYLENVDEESPKGMAHTVECQKKVIASKEKAESGLCCGKKQFPEMRGYNLEHQSRNYGCRRCHD